ncbi:hypothetical protein HAZT_HAZT002995 [Hyalella azteca]|uniref:Uncharacterized protein n=1 Tax=Hyalella azteca TaxID=294128 RepID=A0A6A0GQZ5_HYAAZ|nr:hypothetical protein HAZT_HAZT002995 [Hyalella azteca]
MFGTYNAAVMMHLRFDGTFGFPGGLINRGEDILDGLTRELKEELAYNPAVHKPITYDDYHSSRVFGTVRVPLYTMNNKYGGLPAFLNNRFIGCAKQELIMALFSIGILTDDQIDELIDNANNMKLAPNRM